jgi:hypothetical protein
MPSREFMALRGLQLLGRAEMEKSLSHHALRNALSR